MGELFVTNIDTLVEQLTMCYISYKASEDLLKEHYKELASKPFFPGLVSYMKSGPVVPMVRVLSFLCINAFIAIINIIFY